MVNIKFKDWFLALITLILVTDIAILLDIPVFRQALSFLCFSILPGLLVLYILRLHRIGFLKIFLLSVGLSISFLMFMGLLINALYPLLGFSKPLSTLSLTISFSVILVVLGFVAYHRSKGYFQFPAKFALLANDKLIFPLLLPLLFPLLSVLGTHLMNTTSNNVILMLMLLLIPLYVILLVCVRSRVSPSTYPVAISMIAIALLLMHGLRSNYIMGSDITSEYWLFQLTSNALHWDMSYYQLKACLSISLLPTVYQSLLNINEVYIYKALYPLLFSLTPLACYVMSKRYLNPLYAFLASFFFMAQVTFTVVLPGHARCEIAILFFALGMMVFFGPNMNELAKRALFMVFVFSLTVSHYSSVYVFFFLILFAWLIGGLLKRWLGLKHRMTTVMVALSLAAIFLWWSQLTESYFFNFVVTLRATFVNLTNMFVEELRGTEIVMMYTPSAIIPETISIVWHDITFILLTIGVFSLARRIKKTTFEPDYVLMMLIAWAILAAMVILPSISDIYSGLRTYAQLLVLVTPAFIIGGEVIARGISKLISRRFNLLLITLVLVCQFFCATFLIHQFWGLPYSEDLNATGTRYDIYYFYDSEVAAAEWLCEHNASNLEVHADTHTSITGIFNYVDGYIFRQFPVKGNFFKDNEPIEDGYIFLRRPNVVKGIVYQHSVFEEVLSITEYPHLFEGKSKIYANGTAEIYK